MTRFVITAWLNCRGPLTLEQRLEDCSQQGALADINREKHRMRKLLRMTILAGLMVLFGAAEDGMVFGIGSAQARIGADP